MGLLGAVFSPVQALLNGLFSARVRVEGHSMTPTLEDGQSVLVVRPVFPWNRLQRGDVVVLNPPGSPNPEDWFIKRVAGMPNEEVVLEGGRVYADDLLLAEFSGDGSRQAGGTGAKHAASGGTAPANTSSSATTPWTAATAAPLAPYPVTASSAASGSASGPPPPGARCARGFNIRREM